ncbi:RNase adapter RapZ [Selenomonas dianae]|uniref:RNase adapter RapZ n=1 Tax=Selenomonas dianae TaxID=135079 RepID=A0ABP3CG42_9FIRM|nr:RNase adapter RapZ [Selenomonas dianae]WLD82835.1 RNase adapter RapZ [Selenomonas dianae]
MADVKRSAEKFRPVIVTGLSGGGKSLAARYMEDLGYFCVDNLPPVFIPKFIDLCRETHGQISRAAIVVDTRSREFFDDFVRILGELDAGNASYELLFIEASDDVIIRRYKETRRPHPLAPDARISEGVTRERRQLAPVRARASQLIDTSHLRKAELRDIIRQHYDTPGGDAEMNVNILSFGFKYGIPLDADLVFDVRFLPNPFYVDALRSKSGTVPQVASYIESYDVTQKFEQYLDGLIDFLLPQYVKEGKSQLVIAIGCTGGMHRSVFIAKHLYDRIRGGYEAHLEHRDLMKNEVQEHVSEG